METLNYDNCNCPFCLSSDRERLYLIYLEQFHLSGQKPLRILDFAPSQVFARNLRSKPHINYTSADLMSPHVDLHIDVCNMSSLDSDSYDIVICSHVIEHVSNPVAALSEINRILKKDGIAIIMVPIFKDVAELVENPAYNTDELRLKHYGQRDHVRLYDRNTFLKQLRAAPFTVEEITPAKLNEDVVKKNAISENSILYVCGKN